MSRRAAPEPAAATAEIPPFRFFSRFFGGKGGVGKTTCAAAWAIAAAETFDRRILIVSTDPAHSLGDALGVRLGGEPTAVQTRRGTLLAVELAVESALERWMGLHRDALRTIAERGTYLDGDDIERLLGLSLPGSDELVGLLELARLGRDTGCAEVVVDTAPTAHTLRLLAMPEALQRYASALDRLQSRHRLLSESFGGRYRSDASDALIAEIEAEGRILAEMLRDAAQAAVVWVTLPEALALAETRDAVGALEAAGIEVREIVVNRVTPPDLEDPACPVCRQRVRAEQEAIGETGEAFAGRALRFLPAVEREPRGVGALRRLGKELASASRGIEVLQGGDEITASVPFEASPPAPLSLTGEGGRKGGDSAKTGMKPGKTGEDQVPPLPSGRGGQGVRPRRGESPEWQEALVPERPPSWLPALAPPGIRLLLFGGKGGVGKTTCAAAAALALAAARPEARILLLSTDPAHSLGDVLEVPLGDGERPAAAGLPRLVARELDAPRAFAQWRGRHRGTLAGALGALASGPAGDTGDTGDTGEMGDALAGNLLDAPPPGLDELIAVATLLDAVLGAEGEPPAFDLAVVDTAPTGHALRLLEMPGVALAWDHALLSLLLKYREALGLGALATDLVALSRSLKRLQAALCDPAHTRFVTITRAAELPHRETVRLLEALGRLGVPAPAVLVNAVHAAASESPECRRCTADRKREAREIHRLGASGCDIMTSPAVYPPPRGARALAEWARTWKRASA